MKPVFAKQNLRAQANERWRKLVTGLAPEDVWRFGKYKNKATIQWTIDNDVSYLEWCMENKKIQLNDDAFVDYLHKLTDCVHKDCKRRAFNN